jgi:hypothetical protein
MTPSAGRFLTIAAILLPIAAVNRVSADDEPTARAALPPPLANPPSVAGSSQMRNETINPTLEREQPISGPPAARVELSKIQSQRRKPLIVASAHRHPITSEKKQSALSGPRVVTPAEGFRHRSRRSVAPHEGLGPNQVLIEYGVGRLSPPDARYPQSVSLGGCGSFHTGPEFPNCDPPITVEGAR